MTSNNTDPWPPLLGRDTICDGDPTVPFAEATTVPSAASITEIPEVTMPDTDPGDPPDTTADAMAAGKEEVDPELLLQALREGSLGARTEPGEDPAVLVKAGAGRHHGVVDAVRGLREAQGRAWAPTPIAAASSDGANYAAHHGLHAVPRAATPEAPASSVLLNVTLPFLPIAALVAPHPRDAPTTPGARAGAKASLVKAAEEAARHAKTVVPAPRVPDAAAPRRLPKPAARNRAVGKAAAAAITLAVVLVVGGALVWRPGQIPPDVSNALVAPPAAPGAEPVVVPSVTSEGPPPAVPTEPSAPARVADAVASSAPSPAPSPVRRPRQAPASAAPARPSPASPAGGAAPPSARSVTPPSAPTSQPDESFIRTF